MPVLDQIGRARLKILLLVEAERRKPNAINDRFAPIAVVRVRLLDAGKRTCMERTT